MTQKELLYMEDAIKHEQNIICIINHSLEMIDNKKIIEFMESELKKHESLLKKLMNKMEGLSNE